MEILWNQTSRTAWERIAGSHFALQQDWAYGEACLALGSTVLRAEVRDESRSIGVLQLIHRPFLGFVHAAVGTRGPIWRDDLSAGIVADATRLLVRRLPLPRFRALFLTPETAASDVMRRSGFHRVMTPYNTVEIDLGRPLGDLRASLHQKWRNRLNVAETAGMTVRRIDSQAPAYLWLLEAEEKQQRKIGYRALPPALVPAWQASGGKLRAYAVEHDDQIVAAMLFLLHGTRATYHIGWANAEGRRLSAHNLLLWTAMRKLKRVGVSVLDLGGLNTQDSPGIARFKLGSGGRIKTLCGTWFSR